MQNRKDLLQAHRLMTQRAALALMHGEPDPPDRPLRRLNIGMFSSILVAVMVAAVFGIWGVIDPGDAQGLNSPGTLIIDSQSATPYIWCHGGNGKLLCPVVNYASARLALESTSPNQRTVSQASLSNFPRGPEIGIPDLPPLPDPSMLVGQPWSVCAQTLTNPLTGLTRSRTSLVGGQRVGGRALGGKALAVQGAGADWVIWDGQRLRIPTAIQSSVLIALGAPSQIEAAPDAWLNALPQGPDFAPPAVSGRGTLVRGPNGGNARIGEVFATGALAGTTSQFYVLLSNGLARITPTQAALLVATSNLGGARTVTPSAAANDSSPAKISAGRLPQRLPAVVSYTPTVLCAVYTGSQSTAPGPPQVTVGGTMPPGSLTEPNSSALNRLALPSGKAALVGVVSGAQAGASAGQAPRVATYFLVTGGLRYGLPSPDVAGYLGYSLAQQRTLLPASVVDLIPEGPLLDPSRARDPVTG